MPLPIRIFQIAVVVFALLVAIYLLLAVREKPENISYGVSFNTLYARELHLDPKETYDAILEELGVRHLRLAAHWPMIEPVDDEFNFEELDYQVAEARRVGADIILGVGRRLPRWPECHIPNWAAAQSWEEQKKEILEQITKVVNRYKDEEHIIYWQVENEPFLTVFAFEHCGKLDKTFLDKEIELVRSLDPDTPILITDSGNLGTWNGAYSRGDAFGTSVYVYFWNPDIGPFRSVLPPSFYRAKAGLMEFIHGEKPTFLIELSAEPWLLQPVKDTPVDVQLTRMDVEKFKDLVTFAKDTRLPRQYLWGAEWWYWLKLQGNPSMWDYARTLYQK